MDPNTLTRHFRVTAFVDILGWGSLTDGIAPLMLRRIKRGEDLSQSDREMLERLCRKVETASRLDSAVRSILQQLECFAVQERDIEGVPSAQRFLQNRHVTFVRASDSIFVHSSSYRWVVAFVSELLKRGLSQGIMCRAGISCGIVVHFEQNGTAVIDPRSRDISMFGDGITTAVAAERAGKGRGVRALVHSRVKSLLSGPEDLSTIRSCATQSPDVTDELCWWNNLTKLYPNTEHIENCTPPTVEWLESTVERLEQHQDFDWNRCSQKGLERLSDTVALIQDAIAGRNCDSESADWRAQVVQVEFGFSVANADPPDVHFAGGDLVLVFKDWREHPTEHRFTDTLAFRWATNPTNPTPRDDSTFEVLHSEWLEAELRREEGLVASNFAHYILCFNATKTLEIICRRPTQ